jgi:hypothetical protein
MEGIRDFVEKEIKVELEFKDQPFCPAKLQPIEIKLEVDSSNHHLTFGLSCPRRDQGGRRRLKWSPCFFWLSSNRRDQG